MRSAEHLDPEKLKQSLAIADKAIRDAEKKRETERPYRSSHSR